MIILQLLSGVPMFVAVPRYVVTRDFDGGELLTEWEKV